MLPGAMHAVGELRELAQRAGRRDRGQRGRVHGDQREDEDQRNGDRRPARSPRRRSSGPATTTTPPTSGNAQHEDPHRQLDVPEHVARGLCRLRPNRPRKALTSICGLAKKANSEAVVIMATPPQRAQTVMRAEAVLQRRRRLRSGRGCRRAAIIHGREDAVVETAPTISDTPVRMPISPPAANITRSRSRPHGQLAQFGAAQIAACTKRVDPVVEELGNGQQPQA